MSSDTSLSTSNSISSSANESISVTSINRSRNETEWEQLKQSSIAYSAAHGITMVSNPSTQQLIHAPFTLLPTLLPRESFEFVTSLSHDWNQLVDNISRDREFLLTHLAESAKVDSWLKALLDIYQRVHTEGKEYRQRVRFGLYRSDYMIHVSETSENQLTYTPQQIELNTIAASFAGLSTRISSMHNYMLERESGWSPEQISKYQPQNEAIQRIATAFNAAMKEYRKQFSGDEKSFVVVMVVQPGESNAIDQRILEYTLWSQHRIRVIRRTLHEIETTSKFDEQNQLVIGESIAAIVYFRAGYTPRDYPSQIEYDAIYRIECSTAIKCPSLGTHLAGTKKIQQVLAQEGMVERFFRSDVDGIAKASRLRRCFAGLYALELDDEATLSIIREAIANPSQFVLKPQREGGGNNLWHDQLRESLQRMTKEERAAFILMRRIEPRPSPSALLKKSELTLTNCISELGIYSTFVGDGTTVHHSEYCGYLLRTKAVGVDEGGVAAGFSCLSSVLFDK